VKPVERRAIELARSISGAADWRSTILSASPEGRTVMRLESPDGPLFAKHFERHAEAVTAWNALRRLTSCDLTTLRVPRALALDADSGLLLMTAVTGRPLAGINPGEHPDALHRAGIALAELHAQRLDGLEPLHLKQQLRLRLEPSLAEVARAFPASAPALKSLSALVDRFGDLEGAASPLHGDYQLRQLCDDGVGMGVVDWDLLAAGDPAYDVAYFSTYLINHAGPESAARGIEAFHDGYRPSPELRTRLPIYEAFNYLRRCCRRLRIRDAGWRAEATRMLERLDQIVSSIERNEPLQRPPR